MTITEIGESLRLRKVSSAELTSAALKTHRAARLTLNAFITVTAGSGPGAGPPGR